MMPLTIQLSVQQQLLKVEGKQRIWPGMLAYFEYPFVLHFQPMNIVYKSKKWPLWDIYDVSKVSFYAMNIQFVVLF